MKALLHRFGIDRSISYVLLGKVVALAAQPVTLFFIGKYLTGTEQGFYYTFANIIALSILLELGLGTILTQFASHEFAFLQWDKNGQITGDDVHLKRLLVLGKKTFNWYAAITTIFVIALIPVGIFFFKTSSSEPVHYLLPWILLVVFNGFNIMIYPLTAMLEGCGRVADMQLMRTVQLIISSIFVWIVLYGNGALYAASALAIANFIISVIWIKAKYRNLIKQKNIITKEDDHLLSWRKELLPLQGKTAVSWMCGYAVSQLYTPLLFKYQSPVIAGQMGMTISIAGVVTSTSIAWLSTKLPLYGQYISAGKIKELDQLSVKSTIQALMAGVIFSLAAYGVLAAVKVYLPDMADRILPLDLIAVLFIANLFGIITTSLAAYLRSYKQEPFMFISIVQALLISVSVYFAAKYYNVTVLVYCVGIVNVFVFLPATTWIFFRKKQDWNKKYQLS